MMEIESAQNLQVRQAIVKKFCEYIVVFLFILVLLCVNQWCIFTIIVSTKNLDKSQKHCLSRYRLVGHIPNWLISLKFESCDFLLKPVWLSHNSCEIQDYS